MTIKRTILVSIIIFFSLLFIGFACLSCLFLFVPQYVESEVIPSIIKDNGLKVSSLKVRSIGLKGAEISDVKIGPDTRENFEIDSIRLDYSISGLLARRLERVTLSGISVDLEYKNNQITIKGLQGLTTSSEASLKNDNSKSEPFIVNKLSIVNSICSLNVDDKRLRVPFDLTATSFDQYQLQEEFTLEIFPGNSEVTIEGHISDNKDIKLRGISNAFSLSDFEDIVDEIIPIDIKGLADIEVTANLSQEPISITDLSAILRLHKTTINCQGVTIRNTAISENSEQPINIQVKSKDLKHWECGVSQTLLDTKPTPIMFELSGTADLSDDTQRGNIKAITRIMTGYDPLGIKWNISAEGQSSSNIYKVFISGEPDTAGEETGTVKVSFDDMLFKVTSPDFNLKAEYNNGIISGSYLLSVKNIESVYNEMNFSMPMVSVKGNIDQTEGSKGKYVSTFLMTSKDIAYKGFDITMNIPDYQIKGTMQYDMGEDINTHAIVSFKNGNLSMSGNSLNVNMISANIPFYWPPPEIGPKGSLVIRKIVYENFSLGPVDIDIQQKHNIIPFSGDIKFPALPDMAIKISGNTTIEPMLGEGKMNIDIPSYIPASGIDLGKFLPALKGYYYKGILNSRTDIKFSDSGLRSGLNLKIDSGTIENSEKSLSLEDISLDIKLEDLVSIKSPFGQRLKVERIAFGDIQAEDFIFDFKIDGPSLLFVEKGSFKWCGGQVNIQSFRVNPEKEEYDITLFCDRLKLSEILAQFGVANASGGGTVNGKLPVKISKNKIRFDNGFLYSTPGGGGKISITETDILTKGLDPNSPEYAQMDIAREALKAYDYTWVKMSFESEKDELLLKLQFDGKPENRLPFRYSEDAKKFIRVNNSAEGTDFEGIGLDVNFRVPFDRILNIKDVLDMME